MIFLNVIFHFFEHRPSRKTPTPTVGKMPWLKKKEPSRASKFGPPVTGVSTAVPPPTQVTAPLTLGPAPTPAISLPPSLPPVAAAPPPAAVVAPPAANNTGQGRRKKVLLAM